MAGLSTNDQVLLLMVFVDKMLLQTGNDSKRIGDVLTAIQYEMKSKGFDIGLFKDERLKLGKKAGRKREKKSGLKTEKRPRRLPVTYDYLLYLKDKLWHGKFEGHPATIETRMAFLSIELAWAFMMRGSEYIWHYETDSRDKSHAILANDVEFHLTSGESLKPWELRNERVPFSKVDCIRLAVQDSKTDQLGDRARNLLVEVRNGGEAERGLGEDLYVWANTSGVVSGDPFFSRREDVLRKGLVHGSRRLILTRKLASEALKEAANDFGLSGIYFSLHCCRIGGATSMAAAGCARERIKRIADWAASSDCDLLYQRLSGVDGNALSVVDQCLQGEGRLLSVKDVSLMRPIQRESSRKSRNHNVEGLCAVQSLPYRVHGVRAEETDVLIPPVKKLKRSAMSRGDSLVII
jgi:hypothetical protein